MLWRAMRTSCLLKRCLHALGHDTARNSADTTPPRVSHATHYALAWLVQAVAELESKDTMAAHSAAAAAIQLSS